MRSSRSATDPLDPGPAGFAHRGLHGPGIPENSMAAFRAALDAGAGIECDVRLSGDGEVVIFHDHDLRRLCASALAVESATARVLSAQRLYDSGEHIPTLGQLLDLVAGRVPILVELKCRGGNASRLSAAVADRLADYAGSVGVMSFEPKVGRWFGRNRPHMQRGLVISERASAFDRWRGTVVAKPHFIAVDRPALNRPWVTKARLKHWLYSWTIRTAGERETAQVQADALIWEGDGRPRI
ncbi:MAG: glycerophosphodiester phosphodiesterase family protein [Sphingomicrobium sp.]